MNKSETKPIICGTDFSEGAAQAAVVTDAFARHLNAPLILLRSADERGDFPDHLRERLMNDDRPRMAQEAKRLRGLGLTFAEMLIHGDPGHGIADFAARERERLVVVGASGMGSLWSGRLMLGNVAERIAETSSVPTLVVRATEPFVAWAHGERPLKVFVAVDLTATAEAALRWVAEWQEAGPCEITLGYVHCQPNGHCDLAMFDSLGLTCLTPQAREGLEHDLRTMASRLGVKATIRVEPRKARVDAHLILMATEAGADVFVLGVHQSQNLERVWHASISRRCLHNAPMSIVCVPVPIAPQGAAAAIATFSRVLVATDFSQHAGYAIPYAYAALAREGAVCLLHIAKAGKADEKTEVMAHEAKLRALIPVDALKRGVVTEVRIVESSDPGKTICEVAERFCADLVCIGSHGHSGMAAALMGSVAQAVTAHSRSPVLLIRTPQRPLQTPTRKHFHEKPIHHQN